jgi:chromosome segregation ATPase
VKDEWICIFCNIKDPDTAKNDYISLSNYIEKLAEQHYLLLKHTRTLEKLMTIQRRNTLELEIQNNKLRIDNQKYDFYRDKLKLYESILNIDDDDRKKMIDLVNTLMEDKLKLEKDNKKLKERGEKYDQLKSKYNDLVSENDKMILELEEFEESSGVYLNEIFIYEGHVQSLKEKIKMLDTKLNEIEEKQKSVWQKIMNKIRKLIH